MREILLTRGMVALVDDEDYDRLSVRSWSARWNSGGRCWYAVSGGVLMHREVLGLQKGDPREGDHLEPEDTLNNQKLNLRIATHAENQANRRKNRNNTSGRKGVHVCKRNGGWQVVIGFGGKNLFLGRFKKDDLELAASVYAEAAARYHGSFARL